jgi:peptide/nickel transport system substrate-binding protein
VEFKPTATSKLKRFDGYQPDTRYTPRPTGFGGYKVACLDTVTFRIVTEPGARVAGLETGEFHAVEDVPARRRSGSRTTSNITLRRSRTFWMQIALTRTRSCRRPTT